VRSVIVHPEAEEEIKVSATYINDDREGYGYDLVLEVQRAYENICRDPARWRRRLYGYRRYVIQRFGFLVWYQERGDKVFVIAVHHSSRKPGYWKKRILDEQR
jgi:toxin ParE1/3/4